ncbi:MAG: hypothetical protein BVN34_10110 [Proteobacteria bacterium ST_bin12]|nr:MAG: hypothetical protein BVN34_10110 [Proteobacteria bacterium ST_bin12]
MTFTLINLFFLPIIFLLLAKLLIKSFSTLENSLSEHNPIKTWLLKNRSFYSPAWLANRIDAIFTISIIIMLIGVTFAYS